MRKKYIAGIDIGTTGTKAAIFDTDGNMIASCYKEYACSYPKPAWIEQDVSMLVDSAIEASNQAISKNGINPENIVSLGLSTQRSCTILVDRQGKIIRPMISWQDFRATEEVEYISSRISPKKYYKITGFPNNTTWLLPKLLWLRKNEPKNWNKVYKIVQLQDYTLKAFGADDYYNDISDAGFSGLWDTTNLEWSNELLELFDIDKNLLPVPIPSGKIVGKISKKISEKSGFRSGMPICIGAGDQNSASVGAGIVYDGYMSVSMGTAGNANAYLSNPFRDPNGKAMVLNHAIYGKWVIEGHQAQAAGVFRWFRDEIATMEKYLTQIGGNDAYELLDKLVIKTLAGSKGLVFLPYFAGSTAPRWNPNAKGVLLGLTFAHDRGCLARAFIEGITLEMKDIITSMLNSGIKVKHIRIMGGSTKSDIWNQIQADMYERPVETLRVNDAAVMGAAIMGAVGIGIFKDIVEGVSNMVKIAKKYEPIDKNTRIYNELYDIYCSAYKALDEGKVFNKLLELQKKYYNE